MPIPGLFALRPIVCVSSALLCISNKAESLFPAVLVSEGPGKRVKCGNKRI